METSLLKIMAWGLKLIIIAMIRNGAVAKFCLEKFPHAHSFKDEQKEVVVYLRRSKDVVKFCRFGRLGKSLINQLHATAKQCK